MSQFKLTKQGHFVNGFMSYPDVSQNNTVCSCFCCHSNGNNGVFGRMLFLLHHPAPHIIYSDWDTMLLYVLYFFIYI